MRRTVLLEPRGHADLLGAVLTEPTQPGSDAGVLFMDADGFVAMSGHGVMAVATLALARTLIVPRDPSRLVLDTPAGTVRLSAVRREDGGVARRRFCDRERRRRTSGSPPGDATAPAGRSRAPVVSRTPAG